MFYYIQKLLINEFGILRVFKSISLRASLSFLFAFLFVLYFCPKFILYLKKIKMQDTVREDGPKHQSKNGTPTMGGLLIMIAIMFSTLLFGNLENKYILFLFIMTIPLTMLGAYDDFVKFSKSKKGLSAKKKMLVQFFIAIITLIFIYKLGLVSKTIDFSIVNPFIKNSYLYLGIIPFFIYICCVILGTSNAVNLTDGLDGLVSGPLMIVFTTFLFITYLTGNINYAKYLNLYYVQGSGEIAVFIASIIGGILGFVWYNFYPAQIFMGDTGSLALGGLLALVAIIIKLEILIPIAGMVFIFEALSVFIQVYVYKKKKKRVFKMAPIHHHFELKGTPETKVTIRFWIFTILTCLLTLVILKLR